MQAFFFPVPSLLRMSGQASILIVLVLVAQWVCGRRLQPRWRCGLWLLVLLRLALPWTIPCPTSLFNVVRVPVAVPRVPTDNAPIPRMEAPLSNAERIASAVSSAHGQWLVWSWAAGALFFASCAAANHLKLRQHVAGRRPLIQGRTLNLLEDCKELMGVATPVTLIETEAIGSPTLFGFVRPRLLLPPGLAASFTADELRHVFLHELAHIKRRDVLAGWVMLGLQTLHWFNPLVWLAFHRLRADRELACDALALSHARAGENESYGLTIVKLLEGFGQSVWAPSLAGILENKKQMKERISMIATFRGTNGGLALAVSLFAGLALVTLTDAQNNGKAAAAEAGNQWDLQQKLRLAEAGNQWAVYDLWDAYFRGNHGMQANAAEAEKWLKTLVKDIWVVRFEPVEDFAPSNPQEFLERINQHSSSYSGKTNIGAASFFRTTKQGDKLVGSFLSDYPEELKASLAKVPGLKVTSAERITPQAFVAYEESPQESLWSLAQKTKAAEVGNKWAAYDLWDAYHRGSHGIQPDAAKAEKWLGDLIKDVWVVRFEPVDDFAPRNAEEFLRRINQHCSCRSGKTNLGAASFFRTTRQGGKLVGSFLSNYPDQLKANLAKVPGLKVIAVDKVIPQDFVTYEESPQESL